jgi:hypothetical protein
MSIYCPVLGKEMEQELLDWEPHSNFAALQRSPLNYSMYVHSISYAKSTFALMLAFSRKKFYPTIGGILRSRHIFATTNFLISKF